MAEIIDGNTLDMVKENLARLQEIYPEAFTEGKVDPQKLLVLLGEDVDSSNEKYSFTWKGKNDCIRLAQSPSKGTLLPCKEESVDWDTTQNLYIEGDNLEVLKLLQKSYLGKVKMIYIDPPYNTGSDFVYEDDFADNIANYKNITGQANKSNPESAGRYHTNWLNMIYPRLKVARTLLSDDGVIFISIDENEVHNMRKVCDEVFGESNFISQLGWQKVYAPKNQARYFSNDYEFILCYSKNIDKFTLNMLPRTAEMNARYKNPDNDPRGDWKPGDCVGSGVRKNGYYDVVSPISGKVFNVPQGKHWVYAPENMKKMIEENRIWFGKDGNSFPAVKQFLSDVSGRKASSLLMFEDYGHTDMAKKDLIKLFEDLEKVPFDTPKPVKLLKMLTTLGTNEGDIILDFFAGSGTTAQAIMEYNAEQNTGKRKYILVQLPEQITDNTEANNIGLYTISDVTQERIRRAGKLIKEQNPNVDTGFRVFKLDTSNLVKWNNTPTDDPNEVAKRINDSLFYLQPDRTDEDFVYEIMLKLGMPLSKNVEVSTIEDKKVYGVKDGAYSILICLEYNVNFELVEKMAESEYDVLIFADRCFADANMLINTEEILKKKGKTLKLF